jgi:hypothetical protein
MGSNVTSLIGDLDEEFSADSDLSALSQSCPASNSSTAALGNYPPFTRECDISMVEVTVTRGKDAPRKILIPDASNKRGGSVRVDVLANPKKNLPGTSAAVLTKLDVVVTSYATCSGSKHPFLTVNPASSDDHECKPVSAVVTKHQTDVYRNLRSWEGKFLSGETFQLWNLLQWFWGAIVDDQCGRIDVSVATCGARKKGTNVGSISVPIHIFPVESYSLKLSIPALWTKKKEESKLKQKQLAGSDEGYLAKSQWSMASAQSTQNQFWFSDKKGSSSTTTSQTTFDSKGRAWNYVEKQNQGFQDGYTSSLSMFRLNGEEFDTPDFSRKKDDPKPWEKLGIKLAIKRDGSDLDFEVGKFLTTVVKLFEGVKSFRDGLSSAVQGDVSVGLTLSGEVNFLVLSLGVAWARKEVAGPRIPWQVDVSLVGKLIDASLSAKYGLALSYTCIGVEYVNVELSATLTFAGEASVGVTQSFRVTDGDWSGAGRDVAVGGEVSATLAVKGTAIVLGQGVKAEATAKAGLKLDSKFDFGSDTASPSLTGDVLFTGAILTVTAVCTMSGTNYQSKPIPLVEPSTLVKGFVCGGN